MVGGKDLKDTRDEKDGPTHFPANPTRRSYFTTDTVNFAEATSWLPAAVAVPSTSTPALSPTRAVAAAVTSISTLSLPAAMVAGLAVTLAGRLRNCTVMGPE